MLKPDTFFCNSTLTSSAPKYPDSSPEVYRREETTMDASPLKPSEIQLDYAFAGTKIDAAKHHLDEGLPNGQKRRSEAAFRLLRTGVEELGVWMRAKGYDV